VRPNDDGQGELKTTTQLQSFSLFVTAEPYSSVRLPSQMLVLENDVRKSTKGRLFVVEDYKLMRRSQYQKRENPLALTLDLKNVPLEMYQARNAVEIAKSRGAEKYAPEILSKAQGGLDLAENALARKANKREIISLARQTTQSLEDARALTAERQEQERITAERAAAAAKAKAEALRAQLLEQFNRILETRDSDRGLVVTMADVLFDTGSTTCARRRVRRSPDSPASCWGTRD